jgi:RNA-directed DNA polymerase
VDKAKPFCISKREVWTAYKRVKANRGAAGVDDQTIEEFEKDLKNNLFKLWNRMSSGSYMPSPVRRVDIPKGDGGTRSLGIPTVSDRIVRISDHPGHRFQRIVGSDFTGSWAVISRHRGQLCLMG